MDGDERLLHVIGIVGDVRDYGLDQPQRGTVYLYYRQRPKRKERKVRKGRGFLAFEASGICSLCPLCLGGKIFCWPLLAFSDRFDG